MSKTAFNIENPAKLWYDSAMNTNFEIKLTYNEILFQRSDRLSITEREIHSYHEILFCMDANATLFTEGLQKRLQGDVILLIPKGHYHFLRVHDEKFPRLKIAFPDSVISNTPCGDIMAELREVKNEAILSLLEKLCHIMEEQPSEKQGFYAYGVFMVLLAELDRCRSGDAILSAQVENGEQKQILRYISTHLSENLTVEKLAKEMNLSPSAITHNFKKEMGISIHRYITQRRLTLAHNLLRSGEKSSKIYMDCGYKNYSSFYKAYLSFFRCSPSMTK